MAIAAYPLKLSAGSALSDPLQIPANSRIVRIGIPIDWTSAPISFQMSLDGNFFRTCFMSPRPPQAAGSPTRQALPRRPPVASYCCPPMSDLMLNGSSSAVALGKTLSSRMAIVPSRLCSAHRPC